MQSSISSFKDFNTNEKNYLYSNGYQIASFSQEKAPNTYTKMSITQIVQHILTILSTKALKNDLEVITRSLEKMKIKLENRPKSLTNFISSLQNLTYGFGYIDSPALVAETITKVKTAIDIKNKIETKSFHELIEHFNTHPEELKKNRELIIAHFDPEMVPLLLDKLSTNDLIDVLSADTLNALDFKKLSKTQILRLCTLRSKPQFSNVRLDSYSYAQNFRQILHEPEDPAQVIKNIRRLAGLTNEEKDAALALYIEHHTIPLRDIKPKLSVGEFLRLAPHLRYVDLMNFAEISLAQELVQRCSNLNALLINNDAMLDGVRALPVCEKLVCADCEHLESLPALPFCKVLDCRICKSLKELPALPVCEQLSCNLCTTLRTLPALPLCKMLNCNATNLKELPELPVCETLGCVHCTELQALPALLFCNKLYCKDCTKLQALPELPLCQDLNCDGCTSLKALPALPVCKKLYCEECTKLQELPALTVCEILNCKNCTSLQALPALSLCKVLICSGCEYVKKLPAHPFFQVLDCGFCKSLRELPPLPNCKKLDCIGCEKLKALPALPICEILDCGGCVKLQVLPALPLCKELDCIGCTLQALPALPVCEKLRCIKCNGLKALPELPFCDKLVCWGCLNLEALPELPVCEYLECSGCDKLKALPDLSLCETLYCWGCEKLQALPALPLCKDLGCQNCIGLKALPALPFCDKLHCNGCTNLTALPLIIGQNIELEEYDIYLTKIDTSILDVIRNQRGRKKNTELDIRLAKWKAIGRSEADYNLSALSVEQKKTLNEWLVRLESTKDFPRSKILFAKSVCNMLADLFKNKEFQTLFFSQAKANNECCEDRAAMSLNEIYTSWKIICISEALPLKEKLKVLTGVAKTLSLRKKLQLMIKKEEESVEIFLYYESTLRDRLQLETAIQNMTYSPIGKRNWIDEEKLVKDVESRFFEELFELPVFQKMLYDKMKKQWDDIDEDFSGKLEQLGDCPKGGDLEYTVLEFEFRQGEIMQERTRKKMEAAKQWYSQAL